MSRRQPSPSPERDHFLSTLKCIGFILSGPRTGSECLHYIDNFSFGAQVTDLISFSQLQIDELRSERGSKRVFGYLYKIALHSLCTCHTDQGGQIAMSWMMRIQNQIRELRELPVNPGSRISDQDQVLYQRWFLDHPELVPAPFRPAESKWPRLYNCISSHATRRSVDDACAICYQPMAYVSLEDLRWCKRECGRSFHATCLWKWFQYDYSCPFCRSRWSRRCQHDSTAEPAPAEYWASFLEDFGCKVEVSDTYDKPHDNVDPALPVQRSHTHQIQTATPLFRRSQEGPGILG
jgi:hypothetical protein